MKLSMMALFVFAAMAGCSGGGLDNGRATHNGSDNPSLVAEACQWPDGVAAATDASTVGCFARPTFEICEGSSNTDDTCSDACSATEYSLSCDQTTPPDALGCKVIPIPTPNDFLFYCCPCR